VVYRGQYLNLCQPPLANAAADAAIGGIDFNCTSFKERAGGVQERGEVNPAGNKPKIPTEPQRNRSRANKKSAHSMTVDSVWNGRLCPELFVRGTGKVRCGPDRYDRLWSML
jgi:hypothetical protein